MYSINKYHSTTLNLGPKNNYNWNALTGRVDFTGKVSGKFPAILKVPSKTIIEPKPRGDQLASTSIEIERVETGLGKPVKPDTAWPGPSFSCSLEKVIQGAKTK